MTRLCYFHHTPLVETDGKTACPTCGMLYPTLPAVPTKPDTANYPAGGGYLPPGSRPPGLFK